MQNAFHVFDRREMWLFGGDMSNWMFAVIHRTWLLPHTRATRSYPGYKMYFSTRDILAMVSSSHVEIGAGVTPCY